MTYIGQILKYKKTYKNWLTVILSVMLQKDHVAIMRNGSIIPTLFLSIQVKELEARSMKPEYDNDADVLSFEYKGKLVRLNGTALNGDIDGIFCDGNYGFLDVDGKYVIDVGCNIGDSAMYFALNGAKKVLGYEPYPRVYKLAVENVRKMNLSDVILVFNAGTGSENSHMEIADLIETTAIPISAVQSGIEIPIISLNDVISQIPSSDIMLKMDCEGCEYDALLKIEPENFRKLKKIVMEYHHGPETLVSLFKDMGYWCSASEPVTTKRGPGKPYRIGYIKAERQ